MAFVMMSAENDNSYIAIVKNISLSKGWSLLGSDGADCNIHVSLFKWGV